MPTQAPTGSTSGSLESTAILVLPPGSLEIALISTICSLISGTSVINNFLTNSLLDLESINCGPFLASTISSKTALIRSFGL